MPEIQRFEIVCMLVMSHLIFYYKETDFSLLPSISLRTWEVTTTSIKFYRKILRTAYDNFIPLTSEWRTLSFFRTWSSTCRFLGTGSKPVLEDHTCSSLHTLVIGHAIFSHRAKGAARGKGGTSPNQNPGSPMHRVAAISPILRKLKAICWACTFTFTVAKWI